MPPKLRGIVENTTRKTMCNQTIRSVLHKYDFHGRKAQKKERKKKKRKKERKKEKRP